MEKEGEVRLASKAIALSTEVNWPINERAAPERSYEV